MMNHQLSKMSWMSLGLFLIACAFSVNTRAESLYDAKNFKALVADPRAQNVGDIVTVLVVETATAESKADSSEDAEFKLDASVTDATGLARAGVGVDAASRGEGRTARTGKLRAQLSARIERRLDSGDFFIRGSQVITINGEQQTINVEGVIRPFDITAQNTVLSTRIVDAKIEYVGQGWVSRSQAPGLFRRFLIFIGF